MQNQVEKPSSKVGFSVGWNPVSVVLLAVGIYFVAQFAAGILISIYPIVRGWTTEQTDTWFNDSVGAQFTASFLYYGLTIISVFKLLKLLNLKKGDIGLRKARAVDILYTLAGFALYFVSVLVALTVANQFLKGVDLDQQQQINFDTSVTGSALILVFAGIVALPALAEEILCRGFLYSGLRTRLKPLVSTLIVSVLFAAAHLQWGSKAPLLWAAAIDTFVLSLVLCYLREKTGSLWPAIGLHAIKNSIAFLVLFVFPN